MTRSHILTTGEHALATNTSTPLSLLPTDVAIMALLDHLKLRALFSLLPSKQDMQTLACDLKLAWRQDLQVVQTDFTALQNKVQKLEESQASMQQLISSIQTSSSAWDSHQHTLMLK